MIIYELDPDHVDESVEWFERAFTELKNKALELVKMLPCKTWGKKERLQFLKIKKILWEQILDDRV